MKKVQTLKNIKKINPPNTIGERMEEEKSLEQCVKEHIEARDKLFLELCYALKIGKLCDWLESKLCKLKEK